MTRTGLGAAALVALVASLAACTSAAGSGSDASDTVTAGASASPSSSRTPEPSPTADDAGPCSLLAPDAVEALMGEPITRSRVGDVGGLPVCQMSGTSRWVQFAQVPAEDWAATAPAIVEQLRTAGGLDGVNQARLDEVATRLAAGEYDSAKACELFASMAEFNGRGPGQLRTLAYVPDGVAPQAVSAQGCGDGSYTSLLLAGPDIVVSDETEASVAEAFDLVGTD